MNQYAVSPELQKQLTKGNEHCRKTIQDAVHAVEAKTLLSLPSRQATDLEIAAAAGSAFRSWLEKQPQVAQYATCNPPSASSQDATGGEHSRGPNVIRQIYPVELHDHRGTDLRPARVPLMTTMTITPRFRIVLSPDAQAQTSDTCTFDQEALEAELETCGADEKVIREVIHDLTTVADEIVTRINDKKADFAQDTALGFKEDWAGYSRPRIIRAAQEVVEFSTWGSACATREMEVDVPPTATDGADATAGSASSHRLRVDPYSIDDTAPRARDVQHRLRLTFDLRPGCISFTDEDSRGNRQEDKEQSSLGTETLDADMARYNRVNECRLSADKSLSEGRSASIVDEGQASRMTLRAKIGTAATAIVSLYGIRGLFNKLGNRE